MKFRDCIGTNNVLIECPHEHESATSKKEGVLAVFRQMVEEEVVEVLDDDDDENDNGDLNVNSTNANNDDHSTNNILHLMLTDGYDTYYGRIVIDSIKLPKSMQNQNYYNSNDDNIDDDEKERQTKFNWISNILLYPNKDITIVYTQSGNRISNINRYNNDMNDYERENDRFIKLYIKQSERRAVRQVYSGELLLLSSHTNASNTSTPTLPNIIPKSDILTFLSSITTSYNKSQNDIQKMTNKTKELQTQVHSWKDTAMKLSSKWQYEKDETLQSFLVLLNYIKQDLISTKEELKLEKEKYLVLQEKYASGSGGVGTSCNTSNTSKSSSSSRRKRNLNQRELVKDHQDEHDVQLFDEREVDLLSQGLRVNTQTHTDTNTHTNTSLREDIKLKRSIGSTTSSSMRVNKSDRSVGNTPRMNEVTQSINRQITADSTPSFTDTTCTQSHSQSQSNSHSHSQSYSQSSKINHLNNAKEIFHENDLFKQESNHKTITSSQSTASPPSSPDLMLTSSQLHSNEELRNEQHQRGHRYKRSISSSTTSLSSSLESKKSQMKTSVVANLRLNHSNSNSNSNKNHPNRTPERRKEKRKIGTNNSSYSIERKKDRKKRRKAAVTELESL